MAHFRRKKPAVRTYGRKRDKWADQANSRWMSNCWLSSWPAYHDILYHRRPERRKTKAVEHRLIRGEDPEGMLFPLGNSRPHKYYW